MAPAPRTEPPRGGRWPARRRAALWAVALVLAAVAQQAAPAGAQPGGVAQRPSADGVAATPIPAASRPPGRRLTATQAVAAAGEVPRLRRALSRHPGATPDVALLPGNRWRVSFHSRGGEKVAEAVVDDRSGRVLERWTGIRASWPMARGQEGAFGRAATAAYVWLPLVVAFLLPFARPPWRLLHLDLLALVSLSVSLAFFSHGRIHASVPLAYPPLLHLLVRMLAIARDRSGALRRTEGYPAPSPASAVRPAALLLPGTAWLWAGAAFLLGLRLALQVASSNVIDVGYAGVIGADRITHGEPLYGGFPSDNPHGDTYGPLNYLAYVPFELLLPWSGTWDDLPAAHAASATFDLACVALVGLLGRRIGGPRLAAAAAYCWLACPFTLLAANSGANDQLVGALVLAALAAAGSPSLRGAAIGAAAMVKLAPLALLPLFARGLGRREPWRGAPRAATACAAVIAAALLPALGGGLATFADRTVGFQLGRDSPFSLWGLYGLPAAQAVAAAIAAMVAVAVALTPRRRDLVSLAALTAAVLLAAQIAAGHWFHLYLPWLLGPLLLALLGHYLPAGPGRSTGSIDSARPASPQRISTALSQGSSVAAS